MQVSTLNLFKQFMAEEKSLPKEQPYKDLEALINFIVSCASSSRSSPGTRSSSSRSYPPARGNHHAPMTIRTSQTFFPKNRGHWKHFSSI